MGRPIYYKSFIKTVIVSLHLLALTLVGCIGQAIQGGRNSVVDEFPDDVFPPAVPAKYDGFSLASACPNPAGLEHVTNVDAADLVRMVSDHIVAVQRGDMGAARKTTDQAYWPILDSMPTDQEYHPDDLQPLDQSRVSRFGPASASPHAQLIKNNCGEDTLKASWWVQTGPSEADGVSGSQSLTGNFYLIRRQGHWLIWGAE